MVTGTHGLSQAVNILNFVIYLLVISFLARSCLRVHRVTLVLELPKQESQR